VSGIIPIDRVNHGLRDIKILALFYRHAQKAHYVSHVDIKYWFFQKGIADQIFRGEQFCDTLTSRAHAREEGLRDCKETRGLRERPKGGVPVPPQKGTR
jgi:hypothetical protein